MKINFTAIIFTFMGLYRCIDFEYFAIILGGFWRFGKILKSKMGIQDGGCFDIIL